MSLFKTAYDTQACNGFVTNKIEDTIQNSLISGWIPFADKTNIRQITGSDSISNAIPAFAHPFAISNKKLKELSSPTTPAPVGSARDEEYEIVIDVRPFGRYDEHQAEFIIRNMIEYKLLLTRAQLNQTWLARSPELLRDISPLTMQIWCSWISEAIARRYALDAKEQLNIAILAGYYYQCLFLDADELDERHRNRMALAISRNVRYDAKTVLEVIDRFPGGIQSISEFCAACKDAAQTVRLADLNVGIIYQILKGSWFGPNAGELVAVALEHPPTWIALIAASITERGFKNTGIQKLVERSRMNDTKQFMHALLNLIDATAS